MPLRNTDQTYGSIARSLHWATAFLILILFALGIYMHDLPQNNDVEVAAKIRLFSIHKTLGIIAFGLAIIRVFWALTGTKPHPLSKTPPLQHFIADTVHWLLYVGILITPLAGYLHHLSISGSATIYLPVPDALPFVPQTADMAKLSGSLHFLSACLMGVSIILHVAGALLHGFILRDDTLRRMIPMLKSHGSQTHAGAASTIPQLAALGIFGGFLALGSLFMSSQETHTPAHTPLAEVGEWVVDYENSTLEVQILQMGEVVVGTFEGWEATINFDAEKLESSSIKAVIKLDSIQLGMVSEQALGPDFLNVEIDDLAVWEAAEITLLPSGQYRADGKLALRGVEVPVPLEFSLSIYDQSATAEAITDLNRMDFGIGSIGYTSEDSLGFVVRIRVAVSATRPD